MKRFNAFTLAEVLITLGIIGVVAALTMPSLIQNHRKKVVETKLVKIYSVMNQALNMSRAEYGDFSSWTDYIECTDNNNCTSQQALNIIQKYIGKYIKYTKLEEIDVDELKNCHAMYFNDGSILLIFNSLRDMLFIIDKKDLNHLETGKGTKSFNFRFSPTPFVQFEGDERDFSNKGKGFDAYSWNWDGTKSSLYNNKNQYGCGQKYNNYCTKLIQINGWKIPEDYPLKF